MWRVRDLSIVRDFATEASRSKGESGASGLILNSSPPVTVRRYYFFGDGRTLQVVKEQDEGHDPGAELQTGQNRTMQAHPHFPLHTFPLNVWPVATVATVAR